jgi:chaperonin GroEL (HSP60 family)
MVFNRVTQEGLLNQHLVGLGFKWGKTGEVLFSFTVKKIQLKTGTKKTTKKLQIFLKKKKKKKKKKKLKIEILARRDNKTIPSQYHRQLIRASTDR